MEGEDHDVVTNNMRWEVDTSAPFRSVKEAVVLFGERVLANELYANKLKEMQNGGNETESIPNNVTLIELEETRQRLEKAKSDGMLMATCLSSLQAELELTKQELEKLKEAKTQDNHNDNCHVIKDIKFVEDLTKFEVKLSERTTVNHHTTEFQKKRYMTFANPPSLAKVMVPQGDDVVLARHSSLREKKKKRLIPLIGVIFGKKKNYSEVAEQRA